MKFIEKSFITSISNIIIIATITSQSALAISSPTSKNYIQDIYTYNEDAQSIEGSFEEDGDDIQNLIKELAKIRNQIELLIKKDKSIASQITALENTQQAKFQALESEIEIIKKKIENINQVKQNNQTKQLDSSKSNDANNKNTENNTDNRNKANNQKDNINNQKNTKDETKNKESIKSTNKNGHSNNSHHNSNIINNNISNNKSGSSNSNTKNSSSNNNSNNKSDNLNKISTTNPNNIPKKISNPDEEYREAYQMLKKAKRTQNKNDEQKSTLLFKNFVEKYPQSHLVTNAYFWIGQTYYDAKNYKNAQIYYLKSYKANSKGIKAQEALVQLSNTLLLLNKKEETCATLYKLQKDFQNNISPEMQKNIKTISAKAKCW